MKINQQRMSLEQILLEEQAKEFCHIRDTILKKFVQKRKEFRFQAAVSPVTSTTMTDGDLTASVTPTCFL